MTATPQQPGPAMDADERERAANAAVLPVLRAARTRITPEDAFTGAHMALTARGRGIASTSPKAVRWDAYGALCAESGTDWRLEEAARQALQAAAVVMGYRGPVDVCQNGGHGAALRMLDAAIAAEEGKG